MRFEDRIIYMYLNGEVEGFVGFGPNIAKARQDATGRLQLTLSLRGERFEKGRILKDLRGLTSEQRDKINQDFHNCQ